MRQSHRWRGSLCHCREASNEVILEGANDTFCGSAAMDAGRGELEVDKFTMEEIFC
jgi:hypothetical protein